MDAGNLQYKIPAIPHISAMTSNEKWWFIKSVLEFTDHANIAEIPYPEIARATATNDIDKPLIFPRLWF